MATHCYCNQLRSSARKLSALYDAALAPAGVTVAQFALLRNIERRQPASLTDLGRRLELDRSTLGRNVRVVERMGLVRFCPGDDQRKTLVALTPDGEAALQQAIPLWQACQTRVAESLGPDRIGLLSELIDGL
jgi:DNA-binding MarR family transcriptional regulator